MIMVVPALVSLMAVSAAGDTWALVEVDAADAMMGLGAQVTRQLVEGAQAQHLNALGPEQVRGLLTPEKYAALKKCRDSVACVSSAVAGTPITRVVTGSLTRDEKNYLLKLWHHDVKGGALVCDVDRAVLIAARRLQKDVEQAVPPLLRGEREARGSLVIECNVATAQISVNGEFMGTSPVTMSVKPGKYEVKVEKARYLPMNKLLTVEANQTTKEVVKLLLIPGQTPEENEVPKLAGPDQPAAATAGGVRLSAPTWIFGGVTVATGVAAGIFAGLAAHQSSTLLAGLDAPTGVYTGTRAQALEQNRNALVANVSFVALGVAAAATVVFLIIDLVSGDDAPKPGATP
jgi:hypothetical protein